MIDLPEMANNCLRQICDDESVRTAELSVFSDAAEECGCELLAFIFRHFRDTYDDLWSWDEEHPCWGWISLTMREGTAAEEYAWEHRSFVNLFTEHRHGLKRGELDADGIPAGVGYWP